MGKIYFVLGKSASGKDTIYHRLKKDSRLKFEYIVGYTTRPMREGEKEGREYHFVTEPKLMELKEQGSVIESRCYHTIHGDWYYATVNDGTIHLDQSDYLVIGTLESYQSLLKYFGEDSMFPIYINVEDGLRLQRALSREREQKEPKYAEMCRRFLADAEDFSEEQIKRAGIRHFYENIDLEQCYEEIVRDICLQKQI